MNTESNERRVLTSEKFAVDLVPVTLNDGRVVDKHRITHPGAVIILPVLDDGRVVMIRNFRYSVGRELWELPAGTLEVGEDPALCAGRELIEEAGYEASSIEPISAFFTMPGLCTERMHAYVARGLTHVGQALEENEHIEVEIVTMDDALAMIRDGRIEDGKTIATLLMHHVYG
ncbi:MAG: NUDIX domain-containing protein [Phycisphaera sp.]|nr:NUDIX domain-containing protein [Phycisphaera sp.]